MDDRDESSLRERERGGYVLIAKLTDNDIHGENNDSDFNKGFIKGSARFGLV